MVQVILKGILKGPFNIFQWITLPAWGAFRNMKTPHLKALEIEQRISQKLIAENEYLLFYIFYHFCVFKPCNWYPIGRQRQYAWYCYTVFWTFSSPNSNIKAHAETETTWKIWLKCLEIKYYALKQIHWTNIIACLNKLK